MLRGILVYEYDAFVSVQHGISALWKLNATAARVRVSMGLLLPVVSAARRQRTGQ